MEQQPLNLELPQANHLLGFKEDKRPSRLWFWLIVLASLAICGTAAFLLGKSLLDQAKLPKDTVAWVLLRRGTELPEVAPRIWREATKDTRWPLIIGIAKDEQGWLSFAITHRWNDSFSATKKYSWLLVTAGDRDSATKRLDTQGAIQATFSLLTHSAYARLELNQLDPSLDFRLQGPIDGRIWRTNLPLKETTNILPTDKEGSIDLDAWPDAWPAINTELKQMLNGTEVAERPSFISWTVASGTTRLIDLGFNQAPATSTVYSLAGALGVYDEATLTIPDGSSLVELRWPTKKLEGQQIRFDKPGFTILGLRNENMIISKQIQRTERPTCDTGKITAFFSGHALEKLVGVSGEMIFPAGIALLADKGYLKICF